MVSVEVPVQHHQPTVLPGTEPPTASSQQPQGGVDRAPRRGAGVPGCLDREDADSWRASRQHASTKEALRRSFPPSRPSRHALSWCFTSSLHRHPTRVWERARGPSVRGARGSRPWSWPWHWRFFFPRLQCELSEETSLNNLKRLRSWRPHMARISTERKLAGGELISQMGPIPCLSEGRALQREREK